MSSGNGKSYKYTMLNALTKLLKECMEKNPEYYAPVLDLEKEGEEQQQGKEGEGEAGEAGPSENSETTPDAPGAAPSST
eukprot:1049575-Prorocentrum_minimum.AAC.10